MLHASNRVTIDRPPNDVFAYVADGENAPKWRPGVLDISRVSGAGVGTVYKQGVKGPGGRRVAADYRITAFDRDRRIAFEAIAGPVRPHGRFEFEPTGDHGTLLTFTLEAELTGLKKLLMGRTVARTMETEVGALTKLKQVLEA
jgi:uncharacterized membrane protein